MAFRSYGSTEHPSITGSRWDAPKSKRLYTDGCPLSGVEVRLAQDGQILSRGPDLCLGYTAKVAGTERGVKEPEPVFSALYGEPFFPRPHATYINLFMEKLRKHQVPVWLVNTGWTGGKYGVGKRIDIPVTRAIIRAIQTGEWNQAASQTNPVFGSEVPTTCSGVPATILDPAATWTDQTAFEQDQRALAKFFIERAAKLGLPTEVMAQIPKV